jgi:hypothetical protein
MSAQGHKRKSRTTILMSVKRPKAEVARRRWHFRFVPKAAVNCRFVKFQMLRLGRALTAPAHGTERHSRQECA